MKISQKIRGILMMAIIIAVGFGFSMAADSAATEATITTGALLHLVLSLLSWIWVLPAYLAGNFLTNQRVVGGPLGIDSYLWMIWNTVRNIANFTLAFLFIVFLVKEIFSGGGIASKVKDLLLKLLVSSIAVQASWFLTIALVDLSSIMMAAAGAMPSQFISNSSIDIAGTIKDLRQSMDNDQNVAQSGFSYIFELEFEGLGNTGRLEEVNKLFKKTAIKTNYILSDEALTDLFTPNASNLAGPLIYIGMTMLDSAKGLQNINYDKDVTISVITTILVEGLGIGIYAIMMIFLAVVAFMRIVYLWIFIALAPMIVLIFCLQKVGSNAKIPGAEGISKTLEDYGLGVSQIMNLIFKPVLMILGIGAVMIISTLMQSVIDKTGNTPLVVTNGISIETEPSENSNTTVPTYTTTFITDAMSITFRNITKSFAQILLMVITIIAMWFVIKLAITGKIGGKNNRIDGIINKGMELAENSLMNSQIIPAGKGAISPQLLKETFGTLDNPGGRFGNKYGLSNVVANWNSENTRTLDELLGNDVDSSFNAREKRDLQNTINNIKNNKQWDSFKIEVAKLYGKKNLFKSDFLGYFNSYMNTVNGLSIRESITDKNLYNMFEVWKGDSNFETLYNNNTPNAVSKTLFRDDFWKYFGGEGDAPKNYQSLILKNNFK